MEYLKEQRQAAGEQFEDVTDEMSSQDRAIAAQLREQILLEEEVRMRSQERILPEVSGEPISFEDAADVLERALAEDIQVLDVTSKSSFTNHIIVCSAKSSRHLHALADAVLKLLQARQMHINGRPPVIEGREGCNDWLALDGGLFVCHIMTPAARLEINMEGLWASDEIENSSME